MTSDEERLRELGRVARHEPAPKVAVAHAVMARIRARQAAPTSGFRTLAWIAAGSLALAVPVAIMALRAWQEWTDPLLRLFADPLWGTL